MSAHVTRPVLQYAARKQIFILLIPGSCTWLLQPLDVFVFALLKEVVRAKCNAVKAGSEDGIIGTNDWIALIHDAIHEVLVQRSWAHTFGQLGLGDDPQHYTHHLKSFMPTEGSIVPRPWTDQEVDVILGRHRVELSGLMFSAARMTIQRRLQLQSAQPAAAPLDESG